MPLMDSKIKWDSFNKDINDVEIDFYPVSRRVNNSRNDDSSLICSIAWNFYLANLKASPHLSIKTNQLKTKKMKKRDGDSNSITQN